MASHTSGTILFGFAAVFSCLELLFESATANTRASDRSIFAWWLVAVAFVPITAFVLTLLLLVSHVRALDAAAAGRDDDDRRRRRFVLLGRLERATLFTATAALLAGTVTRIVASGYLGLGGAGHDVGWPHLRTKE